MDAAVLERYCAAYAAQVQAIRDEAAARGVHDAELDSLCDDVYERADIAAIAARLDEVALKIPRR